MSVVEEKAESGWTADGAAADLGVLRGDDRLGGLSLDFFSRRGIGEAAGDAALSARDAEASQRGSTDRRR